MIMAPSRGGIDLWMGTITATSGQRLIAAAIDVAVVVVPAAISVWGATSQTPLALWIGAAVAVVAFVATLVDISRNGRSAGLRIMGLRSVSARTASPVGRRLFAGRRTVSVRGGRDPLDAVFLPFAFPAPTARLDTSRRSAPFAEIKLDTGELLRLTAIIVLGRASPRQPPEPDHFAWVDMSRTLSKKHARLEWDGTRAWVTDLGSTNGTFIERVGASQRLAPFARTALGQLETIRLGDRHLMLRTRHG